MTEMFCLDCGGHMVSASAAGRAERWGRKKEVGLGGIPLASSSGSRCQVQGQSFNSSGIKIEQSVIHSTEKVENTCTFVLAREHTHAHTSPGVKNTSLRHLLNPAGVRAHSITRDSDRLRNLFLSNRATPRTTWVLQTP